MKNRNFFRQLPVLLILTGCTTIQPPVTASATLSPPTPTASQTPSPTETQISTPEPADSPIDITTLTGVIVFSSEWDIFVINADGTGRTQITDHPAADFDAIWSPDGTQIAFRTHRDGDEEVYVMNANGSNQRNLSNAPHDGDYSPAWSPDGTWIAFESDRDGWPSLPDYEPLGYDPGVFGDSEIYLMNVDGSRQINLTNNPREGDAFPAWSHDGYLLFSRYGCLMIMRADGSGLVPLTSCFDGGEFPDWYQPVETTG